ncbi:MAG: hypothetical protein K2J88_00860, partial [Oscillospiraceae bacterium]|nr:hypothetical protein [Oscillospiraceae bacterium]
MKWVSITLIYLSAVFVIGCLIYSFKKPRHIDIEPPIRMLLGSAGLALFLNATAMLANSAQMACILFSAYHFIIDSVVLGMMSFVRRYTNMRQYRNKLQIILTIMADIDGILMLVNCFKPILFQCEIIYDKSGFAFYHMCEKNYLYSYHIILLYIIVILILHDLIKKIWESPKIYQLKYAVILILNCILIIFHSLYLQLNTAI